VSVALNRATLVLVGAAWMAATGPASAQFFDDFNGTKLDSTKWMVKEKAWGVQNGGVVSDNITVSNGMLHLIGHGDLYTGPVQGVDRKGHRVDRVTRVGAAITTQNYFASGKYEVRWKLPPNLGACSAMWTFHYEEASPADPKYAELAQVGGVTVSNLTSIGLTKEQADSVLKQISGNNGARVDYLEAPINGVYHTTTYFRNKVPDLGKFQLAQDFGKKLEIYVLLKNAVSLKPQGKVEDGKYLVRNQEIDIETPTCLKPAPKDISYAHDRFNTWIGEGEGEYTDNFDDVGHAMNDGQFHVFRFDWHTANATTLQQRVEFYIDDKCYQTNYTHIPTIGGRFTVGLWFPTWTGAPNFDTESLDVDWVRITPFNESGDQQMKEAD
jgi:beta-glucanase (GH16 family)